MNPLLSSLDSEHLSLVSASFLFITILTSTLSDVFLDSQAPSLCVTIPTPSALLVLGSRKGLVGCPYAGLLAKRETEAGGYHTELAQQLNAVGSMRVNNSGARVGGAFTYMQPTWV